MTPSSKKIVLVGHCGPDASFLRMAVASAQRGAQVLAADDQDELKQALDAGADLLLLNREMPYGFEDDYGVELIRKLRTQHPRVKTMLVSNYAEAQAEAVAAGAAPGFGKREIGSKRVAQLINDALNSTPSPGTPGQGRGEGSMSRPK